MAQLVKRPILGLGSGHDLTVREFKPNVGLSAVSAEPALDPLPPFLCPSLARTLPLSLKNKQTYKIKKKRNLPFYTQDVYVSTTRKMSPNHFFFFIEDGW